MLVSPIPQGIIGTGRADAASLPKRSGAQGREGDALRQIPGWSFAAGSRLFFGRFGSLTVITWGNLGSFG
jgi:hypothetical protein